MAYASVSTMRPPATPSANIRTSILPMRKRASWAVSMGSSARSSTRGHATVAPISPHPLNPLRARRSWLERVAKVLGLAGHLAIQKLHDAHRVGRPAVIGEDEFRDPEVARADDSAHREALGLRLRDTRGLYVVPAPDALARLRVFEQCVISVYVVLNVKVVCIRRGPVAVECLSNFILIHRPTPVPRRSHTSALYVLLAVADPCAAAKTVVWAPSSPVDDGIAYTMVWVTWIRWCNGSRIAAFHYGRGRRPGVQPATTPVLAHYWATDYD